MGAREHFFQLMLNMYIVKMKKKMYSLASIKGVLMPFIVYKSIHAVYFHARWNQ